MSVTIRPYAPDDRQACRDLWRDLSAHHRELYQDQRIGGDDPGDRFDEYLADPRRVESWVAEDDSGLVGLTGLLVEGKDGEVEPVVVRAGRRGDGLGSRLIEHVKADAIRRGLRLLSIRPVTRNADAIRCFRRAGFHMLGHLEMFQDLPGSETPHDWTPELTLHDQTFRY